VLGGCWYSIWSCVLPFFVSLLGNGSAAEFPNFVYKSHLLACLRNSIKSRFNNIITLEEGVITGGFGDGVASWLLEEGFNGKLKRIGLPDEFIEHGPRNDILSMLGLDAEGIKTSILNMLKIKDSE
jgi:1-deoxy-D-xylulose-5-phosphate synthase